MTGYPVRKCHFWMSLFAGLSSLLLSDLALCAFNFYGGVAANSTEDISATEITGDAKHVAAGMFFSKENSLGENGFGLELTYRNINFLKKESDESFKFSDSAVGFCFRAIPVGGLTLSLGRLTHDIKTTYDPESTLGAKTIDDGKLTGNFLSLGLAGTLVFLQPYVDFTRYWLPKYKSKIDEVSLGIRLHIPAGS